MLTHLLQEIILASASAARSKILRKRHIPFRTAATHVDEKKWCDADGTKQALLRAKAKAQHALKEHQNSNALIIAADQTLSWQGELFDKVSHYEEAYARLEKLQNSTHHLHSAVALAYSTSQSRGLFAAFALSPALTMKPLSSQQIHHYLQSGEWQGSVGCYRIEGKGRELFSSISSDIESIAGLPMKQIIHILQKCGIDLSSEVTFPLYLKLPPHPPGEESSTLNSNL